MAIDTEDKRRSVAVTYGQRTIMPVADGTVGDADRPHARWLYPGLTYQESAMAPHRFWMDFDYYRTEYR